MRYPGKVGRLLGNEQRGGRGRRDADRHVGRSPARGAEAPEHLRRNAREVLGKRDDAVFEKERTCNGELVGCARSSCKLVPHHRADLDLGIGLRQFDLPRALSTRRRESQDEKVGVEMDTH